MGCVKTLQTQNGAVLKSQQQVFPIAGKRHFIGGKLKYIMTVLFAGDVLRSMGRGSDKTYISHDASPACCGGGVQTRHGWAETDCEAQKKPRSGGMPERGSQSTMVTP